MNLLDTNVLLDIATADPIWLPWSENEFRTAAAQGPILINPIIYAELAPAFASAADLDQWLDPAVFQRLPLPWAARWLAAQAFLKYRHSELRCPVCGWEGNKSDREAWLKAKAELERKNQGNDSIQP